MEVVGTTHKFIFEPDTCPDFKFAKNDLVAEAGNPALHMELESAVLMIAIRTSNGKQEEVTEVQWTNNQEGLGKEQEMFSRGIPDDYEINSVDLETKYKGRIVGSKYSVVAPEEDLVLVDPDAKPRRTGEMNRVTF